MKKLISSICKESKSDCRSMSKVSQEDNLQASRFSNPSILHSKTKLEDSCENVPLSSDSVLNVKAKEPQSKLEKVLREKNSSQQVPCLYAEYIYKTNGKDFFYESQL